MARPIELASMPAASAVDVKNKALAKQQGGVGQRIYLVIFSSPVRPNAQWLLMLQKYLIVRPA